MIFMIMMHTKAREEDHATFQFFIRMIDKLFNILESLSIHDLSIGPTW